MTPTLADMKLDVLFAVFIYSNYKLITVRRYELNTAYIDTTKGAKQLLSVFCLRSLYFAVISFLNRRKLLRAKQSSLQSVIDLLRGYFTISQFCSVTSVTK